MTDIDPVIVTRFSGGWYASAMYYDGRMVYSMEALPTEEEAISLLRKYLGDAKSFRVITVGEVEE